MKQFQCAIHLVLAGLLAGAAQAADHLSADFIRPPDAAKAGVWWRWINGNVTREGITRDLTEMSSKGIRSVDIFDVGGGGGVGPAGMMGPLWRELFKHTLTEAARLGVEVRVVAAAGWGIGGPWIGPDDAAKKLSYTESQVDGPCHVSRVLPKPLGAEPFYQDVAVIAFREKDHAPVRPAQVIAGSEIGGYCDERNTPAENVADADPDTCWNAKEAPTPGKPAWVELRYPEPLTATALLVVSPTGCGPKACELQASTDGKTFTKVAAFDLAPGENKPLSFPPVQAGVFRLLMTSAHVPDVQLGEVCMLRQGDQSVLRRGIKGWSFKSGTRAFWDWPKEGPAILNEEYAEADVVDCRSAETIELTTKMAADGTLVWDVPPGRWILARFGLTLVGETPRAMSAALKGGYEADPYSRKAADLLYDNTVKILLADTGPVARKALTGVFLDSYEIGASAKGIQGTWTEGFREEFRKRNGYDLVAYLPAMTRRVVDGRRETNRFFWGYRQVLAELYLDFYSQITSRAHRDGLQMRAENGYGTYPFPHIDGLAAFGRVDVPMGEFWFSGGGHSMGSVMSQHFHYADSVRTAASAAHIYGKPLVAAEALTIADGTRQAPGAWKSAIDEQFCNGLNNTMIHLWSHQPDVAARPGLFTYDVVNANMTWWEQSTAFFDYVGRCQSLLRQGRFVADFCYFFGEETARFVPGRKQVQPALPAGCDFDGINAEVILSRLSCKNGLAVLPDGQTYRYLVLPSTAGWNVTGPVLQKLSTLVHSGMTVIGAKPGDSPRLGETVEQTRKSREIADALWGNDAQAMIDRKVGKGRVIAGKELNKILASDGVAPDVACVGEGASKGDSLSWIHRRSDDTDIYFLANASASAVRQTISFRITGRQPELWDPVTGQQRELSDFESGNGCTAVPLEFEPYGSVFVVFRKDIRNSKLETGNLEKKNFLNFKSVQEITGPWEVTFDPKWGGPTKPVVFNELSDWTNQTDLGIKYYSGTATYRKTFDFPQVSSFKFPSSSSPSAW
jgi:hypothetical protein